MNTRIITVHDGVLGMRAEIRGDWTAAQVAAAWTDGYETNDAPAGGEWECTIRDPGGPLDGVRFTQRADGQGGAECDAAADDYPHAVTWT